MLNNLLIYRLLIVNLIGFIGVGVAHANGWLAIVIKADTTGLFWVMAAFFVASLLSSATRALKVTRNLNAIKRGQPVDVEGTKFLAKGAHLQDFPVWITAIGLIGNVIGIMVAMGAISPADLVDAGATQAALTDLLGGMHIAFSTTVVGGVLAIWASINWRILKTATVLMIEDAKKAATAP